MRLKLDENLPGSAAARLRTLGFEVWAAAQREQRFLITQDLDFSDVRRFAAGTHAGILIVRLPDSEQWRVADHLVAWLSEPEAKTWGGCLVVATPHKVRVSRPSASST